MFREILYPLLLCLCWIYRHSLLTLGRPRTPLHVPASFDDLSKADENWQSGIMFEGIGAQYREEWVVRVVMVVVISNK